MPIFPLPSLLIGGVWLCDAQMDSCLMLHTVQCGMAMGVPGCLNLIDTYEARHGEVAANRRVCLLMVSYPNALGTPLPSLADQTLAVAREALEESDAASERLLDADRQVQAYMYEARQSGMARDRECKIVQAASAIIGLLRYGPWGGGASEATFYFWEMVEVFEHRPGLLSGLVEKIFGHHEQP